VAQGHVPTFTPKHVDPLKGPVELQLKPHDLDRRDPELVLRGRVLDENGNGVAGAVVSPYGFKTMTGAQFGGLKGIDALAVSDDRGEFRLGVSEKGMALYVQVNARFMAPQKPSPLAAGRHVHEIKLVAGSTVTGKVVKDGKPLTGVTLGLVQQDRGADSFLGESQISTDQNGQFQFLNLPPEQDYFLYGVMDSFKPYGALRVTPLRVGANGTTKDAGTLTPEPGHRLTGRIVLEDGKPVPKGTRVLLSREEAWDHQTVGAAPDGSFAFEGLPAEGYSLSVNVKGYRTSVKNRSYDLLNGRGLLGTIPHTIEDLRYLLEPGTEDFPDTSKVDYKEYERRRKGALQGAPATPEGKERQ
jgi:hypothetical protein